MKETTKAELRRDAEKLHARLEPWTGQLGGGSEMLKTVSQVLVGALAAFLWATKPPDVEQGGSKRRQS